MLVNSEEVKGKLITAFGLSEPGYFQRLAIFNERNKEIIYELERDEVIALLFQFFPQVIDDK